MQVFSEQVCVVIANLLGVVNEMGNAVFTLLNAAAANVNVGDIINISNQSNVSYISLDRALRATLDTTAAAVNAPLAWSAGLDGAGVGIAIIDSAPGTLVVSLLTSEKGSV